MDATALFVTLPKASCQASFSAAKAASAAEEPASKSCSEQKWSVFASMLQMPMHCGKLFFALALGSTGEKFDCEVLQVYGGMVFMDFSNPGANRWLPIA